MRRTFELPLKPFSVNAMYYGRRDQKTQAYRDWEVSFLNALNQPKPQLALKELREAFDINKHCYAVRFVFKYNQDVLYTKAGTISSRAFDLTNVEKPILDLICLPKYHVQRWPGGCPNLNIDDKYVIQIVSKKAIQVLSGYSIKISIAIVNRLSL